MHRVGIAAAMTKPPVIRLAIVGFTEAAGGDRGKRGRPTYSPAQLAAVSLNVELERVRLGTPGKPATVTKACKSLAERGAHFHGTIDATGAEHYVELSASALRVAYYRAPHPPSARAVRLRLIDAVAFCADVTGRRIRRPQALAMLKRWGIPVHPGCRVDPAYIRAAQVELSLEEKREVV